jgi:hypothetical protein
MIKGSKEKTIVWVLKRKGVGYLNLRVGFKLPRKLNFYMSSTLKPNFSFLDRKKKHYGKKGPSNQPSHFGFYFV